jgi:AbrB family looped-hinge helix DNA binding protein
MENMSNAAASSKTRISENGRIVIPAAMRELLGVKPGDPVFLDVEDGVLKVESYPARIARIQRELAPYRIPGKLASDELIAERREEARREEEEFQRDQARKRRRSEAKIA